MISRACGNTESSQFIEVLYVGVYNAFNTFSAILYQSVIRHLRNSPVPEASSTMRELAERLLIGTYLYS